MELFFENHAESFLRLLQPFAPDQIDKLVAGSENVDQTQVWNLSA